MRVFNYLYQALCLLFIAGFYSCSNSQSTSGWTQFRGENLSGVSSNEVPVKWSDTQNIKWKTAIHDKGWSSPVIYGNQVWMTTAREDGKELYAVCVDFDSGKIIYDLLMAKPDSVYGKHAVNSYATPTPCIENGFVYIHFGTYGTFCLDTKTGKEVWRNMENKCDHVQGPGSSPILYKDILILHFEGVDVQYLIALDKKTGKQVWKTERPKEIMDLLTPIGKKAYITPIVIQVDGKDLLISNGAAVCIAYDPLTGKEIWRVIQGEDSTISSPVFENGTVYFYTSFISPPDGEKYCELLAVNPKGSGDITKTNILWHIKSPVLQLLTPVIKDGLIYTIDTKSKLLCIDAKNGALIWSQKEKGSYNSSPVVANGMIYFSDYSGKTLIIKEGKTFELIAENQLDGAIWATPAVSGNSILIRTSKYLYRIEEN
ncbi:MAG: PQQ-binding-like beta-propeller repeat protein [Bacteroidales bacterium]